MTADGTEAKAPRWTTHAVLHRIVQFISQETLSERERANYYNAAVSIVGKLVPQRRDADYSETLERCSLHALKCYADFDKFENFLSPQTYIQLTNVARCLHDLGHHDGAAYLLDRIMTPLRGNPALSEAYLCAVSNRGLVFHTQRRFPEAKRLFLEVTNTEALQHGLPTAGVMLRVVALSNLGLVFRDLFDVFTAQKYFEEAQKLLADSSRHPQNHIELLPLGTIPRNDSLCASDAARLSGL